ncbi:glycosyltransferase family 4 protein [Methylicorpusculum oleiharenae]|uniref:glycosyltransferase family 4 protein n=1 Tax=Methylicorpusculum oleiharenae TaxID=1338687 RepID=UPI0013598EE2|nr:glycosyltransferase family 4 protein [Methylicorpusculum oleiharenae]MCD2450826.1 glycosyltransferase family 4 protein [Methylicorpusculum oleiharenae]
MKILHFYRTSYPDTMGGIEQVIHQLARGAAKKGFETVVLSLTDEINPQPIKIDNYTVHRASLDFQISSSGFSISALFRFVQLAKNADIIHYHFPWPFMDLVHFLARANKPSIVTYHSDIIRQQYLLKIYRPLMQRFLGNVDLIVVTSPNYFATSKFLTCFREKVHVIPIGLDKASYPTPLPDSLSGWSGKLGSKFFLFVGVLRYYKGLHILIEAAQGTDYPIAIVGAGPIEQELRKQVETLGLKNIHFLGQLSDEDKSALLTLCYGVVFPSHLRSEAFGISLLEGAMYGKPMISSEIGTGTTFINIANETGLVVPPSNPDALRVAMRFLWENPEKAAEMGAAAEARYWKLFTADRMVEAYIKLYGELVKNG